MINVNYRKNTKKLLENMDTDKSIILLKKNKGEI